jgi:hypothetical protein
MTQNFLRLSVCDVTHFKEKPPEAVTGFWNFGYIPGIAVYFWQRMSHRTFDLGFDLFFAFNAKKANDSICYL